MTAASIAQGTPNPVSYVPPQGELAPWSAGWADADPECQPACELAQQLIGWLPPFHYVDALLGTGLHRFYAWEAEAVVGVGALRFIGTMGDPPADPSTMGADVSVITQNTDTNGDTYVVNSGGEPIPQPNAQCSSWVPDTSNAQIVALANDISYGTNSPPVPWTNQSVYNTTSSDGTSWRLVMWSSGGLQMVSTFRCVPASPNNPPGPAPAQASSGSAGLIFAVLIALGTGAAALFSKSKHSGG